MKTLSLLAFALVAHGEIHTAAKRLPSGAVQIEVRNSGQTGLSAIAIRYQLAGQEGSFHQFFDELTDGQAPQREFLVELPYTLPRNGKGRIPPLAETIVQGAIFTDGTTAGEADLIRRLVLRRANLLQAVEMSLTMIADAGRANTTRARMIADFQRMAESVHRWYLPEEQQTGLRVYQAIKAKLIHLAEGPLGTAFPPNEFVARETAALNRQRTQLLASQPSLADPAQNGR